MSRKKVLYVGGIEDSVSQEVLFAAFIPFGDIKEVSIPRDYSTDAKAKGFAFIEFEEEEDAAQAMFNMEGAELYGRVIRCSYAKPMANTGRGNKAVWSSEEW